jgi:hypothetical protein
LKSAPAERSDTARVRWRLRYKAALCALLLPLPVARAEQDDQTPIPVRLSFTAPEGCARPDDFRQRVAVRSKRIRFVDAGGEGARIVASVTPNRGEVRVRLSLSNVDGTSITREFAAPNCAEGVDAIALVTAISLDRFAKTEPADETPVATESDAAADTASSSSSERNEGETPPDTASSDENSETETEATTQIELTPTDSSRLDTPPRGRDTPPATWHVVLTGALEGLSGAAPVNVAGVSAGAGVWWEGELFAPLVRLVGSHFPEVTYPAEGGDATFRVDAGRLVACPIRLGVQAYGLRPCLAGLGGRIVARGSQTLERQTHSVPLWAGGGALLAVVRPTATILITGELTLLAPAQRDGFRFEPDPEFHRVSSLIVNGGVGFGLEFP